MSTSLKIGAIVYRVADLKRSEKFYRDTLGLEVRVLPLDAHEALAAFFAGFMLPG